MAPKTTTKKTVAEPVAAPAKAKAPKAAKAAVVSSDSEDAVGSSPKSSRIVKKIERIIKLVESDKRNDAITALNELKDSALVKKERKPRAQTAFNKFVAEKMKELKDSGMSTNDRMKECSRLWKEKKAKDGM